MAKERFELSDGVKDLLSGMGKLSAEMKDNSAKAMEYAQSMDKLAKQNTELTKLNEALSTSFSKVSNALNKASSGNDLTKYIKTQEDMVKSINRTYRRYSMQSDELKKNRLAEELYKEVNALRAVADSVDLSNLIGNFEEVKKAISSVGSYVKSEFSVSAFKEINETIEVLEQAGLKIKNVFSTLDKGSKFYDIDKELRETKEQLELINNADVSELTGKLKKLGEIAENEFNTFLNLYNLSGSSYKFYDIFEGIRSGALTSQQAIERVKNEFDYLLAEAKSAGNQNYDILNSSAIREMVENISTLRIKVDEIMTRVSNVHGDTTGIKIFDEEQFNRLLILFEKIEFSLSSMKAVFVDVGDGEEFSPLLKMIDKVQSSIKELSRSVSGIKLDINMDLGSEVNERMNQKVSQTMNRQLEAYRNLFTAMKSTGKTNKEMLRFFEPDDASISEIIGAYKGMIKRAEEQFGKNIYKNKIGKDTYSAYVKEIKNATDQFNRATNKKNTENPLGDLFGKNELMEVVSQLGLIANRLSEISSTVSGLGNTFKSVFKEGFNISASVEEIEKLTNRVKELEDELSKVKVSSTSPVETNISSPIKDTFQGDKIQEATTSAKELDKTLEGVEIPKESFDEVIAKFNIIEEKAKNIAKITQSSVWNQAKNDGKGGYGTSYTVKYKDGSSEILGENSNPQLLRNQNVLYDTQQVVKESNKAYKELIKTIQNYSEVQKRIAKNEAFDGDLALAQKLRGEITELQKQPILSSTQLEEANKRLVKLRLQVEKIKEQTQQTTRSKVGKALVSQLSAWKSIQGIREKIAKTDEKDTTKLQKLNEEKKGYQKQYLEAEKVLKANEDLYDKESQLAKLELERLETNEKINKLKLNNVDIGSVLSKGDDDLKKFEARKNQSEEYRTNVEKLKQSIGELRTLEQSMVKSKLLPDGEAQKINEAVASIEEYTNAIKNMPAVEKGSDEGSRTKLANRIHEYMDKNTRMTRAFREEFENLIRVLRSGDDSVNIKDIARQFEDVKFRVKEAKLEGISFFDIFKNKAVYGFATRLAQYYLSFYDWIRYTRYAINALVELDSALLDLKKTTAMTENQLEDFYYASNDVAKQMGVTTAEIIEQASAWSRLGYSSEEAATKMAQLSSQFASISPGMETDQAQEGLVSIMKAWDIDPDEVESEIMDNINILGNSFAESNSDLVEGMKRSAAALSTVGTDYKDAFALFTGAQEILQNAEVTGRALRSISMRVRGYSESSEDGFEELDDELKNITGDLIDLTKTAEHSQGVSIFKDGSTAEFKSLVEYFGEISEIWDEMTQKQQNDFLQKAFGKTQAQAGAALIQNFEAVRDSLKVMENSAGSADREMSIVQETLEYKINALKQTWVGTVQEMIERGDLGAIIDGLTKFSEAIGKVTGTVGLGGTLGLGLTAFLGIKNIGREKCYPSSNMPIVI